MQLYNTDIVSDTFYTTCQKIDSYQKNATHIVHFVYIFHSKIFPWKTSDWYIEHYIVFFLSLSLSDFPSDISTCLLSFIVFYSLVLYKRIQVVKCLVRSHSQVEILSSINGFHLKITQFRKMEHWVYVG